MTDTRIYPEVEDGTLLTDNEVVTLSTKEVKDCEQRTKYPILLYITLILLIMALAVSLLLVFIVFHPTAMAANFFSPESKSELIFVTMVWRHGDRAPERLFDAIKVSNDAFPNGLGNLTQLGKLQVELFAERIKKRYFSDDDKKDKRVLIRSTQVPRTMESAQIVASVLNIPKTTVTANVNLKVDTEGNPFYGCPTVEAHIQKVKNTYRMKDKYQDVYSLILEKVNYTGDVHPVLDLLHCMKSHNLPTPEWSQNNTFLRILKYLSWNGLAARYGLKPYLNMTQNKLTGGAVLKGVMDKLKNAIECDANDKKLKSADCDVYFSGLSAHDITLAALFSTFPNYKNILSSVPFVEYVANVAFEVWRLPNRKYGIRALYANSFREEPVEITEYLPGCENYEGFCPFSRFADATRGLYYDDINVLHQHCQLGSVRRKREAYFNGNLADYLVFQ